MAHTGALQAWDRNTSQIRTYGCAAFYLELFLIAPASRRYFCMSAMQRKSAAAKTKAARSYDETISGRGLRLTAQRRQVYDALLAKRDHPTAVEVFMRVQKKMPSISLATVYNCLETLAECGLVKHVNLDRAPSRYCPNLEPHGHFFCEACGAVFDVPPRKTMRLEHTWEMPRKAIVSQHEVSFRGLCAECAKKESKRNPSKAITAKNK